MSIPPNQTRKPADNAISQATLDYYASNRKTYDGPRKKIDDKVKDVAKELVKK